jgi:Na+-driven multidrug efflux pump
VTEHQWQLAALAVIFVGFLCHLYVIFCVSKKSMWLAYLSFFCYLIWLPVAFLSFKHKHKTLIVGTAIIFQLAGLLLLEFGPGAPSTARLTHALDPAVATWRQELGIEPR